MGSIPITRSNNCALSSVDRVPGYEPVGRRFESSRARHKGRTPQVWGVFSFPLCRALSDSNIARETCEGSYIPRSREELAHLRQVWISSPKANTLQKRLTPLWCLFCLSMARPCSDSTLHLHRKCEGSHIPPEDRKARFSGAGCGYFHIVNTLQKRLALSCHSER